MAGAGVDPPPVLQAALGLTEEPEQLDGVGVHSDSELSTTSGVSTEGGDRGYTSDPDQPAAAAGPVEARPVHGSSWLLVTAARCCLQSIVTSFSRHGLNFALIRAVMSRVN